MCRGRFSTRFVSCKPRTLRTDGMVGPLVRAKLCRQTSGRRGATEPVSANTPTVSSSGLVPRTQRAAQIVSNVEPAAAANSRRRLRFRCTLGTWGTSPRMTPVGTKAVRLQVVAQNSGRRLGQAFRATQHPRGYVSAWLAPPVDVGLRAEMALTPTYVHLEPHPLHLYVHDDNCGCKSHAFPVGCAALRP
jgi:hypothetical protein